MCHAMTSIELALEELDYWKGQTHLNDANIAAILGITRQYLGYMLKKKIISDRALILINNVVKVITDAQKNQRYPIAMQLCHESNVDYQARKQDLIKYLKSKLNK